MTNVDSTLAAIEILKDLKRWKETSGVGHAILIHAWCRLEREVKNYLTGEKNDY